MTITGITTTADNGVERITNNQQVTGTGSIDGECVVLDGATSVLETGTTSGVITIINSSIIIDSDTGTGNDAAAVLNFGGRTITATTFSLVDSIILIKELTTRHNIQVTELTNCFVIESGGTAEMFVYTGTDAIIDNVLFRGINVWEIYAPPSVLFAVTVDGPDYGYLNWEAGRLDFFGFSVANIGIAHAWQGTGASDNSCWHWNNDPSFNNQLMYLTAANNSYYDGFTASWEFIDQITTNPVSGALLIFKDDFTGSEATRGTYTTDINGRLVGTFDSQNRSTGSSQSRPTLFMILNSITSIDTGSPGAYSYPTTVIGGDAGNRSFNYDIDPVQPAIEVRSYAHLSPQGFGPNDVFSPTEEIGSIASDLSVNVYQQFVLIPDTGITGSKALADALTSINNANDFYDRTKAEWRDNNGYPLLTRDGITIDMGGYNLIISPSASLPWTYTAATSAIGISTGGELLDATTKFTKIKTTGTITLSGGADTDIILTDQNGSRVFVILDDIVEGSQYRIERDSNGVEIVNAVAENTTSIRVPFIWTVNETVNIDIRRSTFSPRYLPFSISGTVTENGLTINVSQIEDTIAKATGLLSQLHYRWRNDDGDEDDATWKQNEDIDHTNQAKNQNIRLRILVDEVNNEDIDFTPKLQFRKSGDAEWSDVEV